MISETAILNPEMVADVRRVGGTGVRSDKVVAETAQAMIDDAGEMRPSSIKTGNKGRLLMQRKFL